jgi:predicted O-methyltransferase YrrM
LYDLGVPISIVIDDYLPILNSTGGTDFAFIDSAKELWPVLVEKAFSKLNGDYWSIVGGWPW